MSKKNLKANHNGKVIGKILIKTVLNLVKEKFESKSQRGNVWSCKFFTVLNLVKEKFESKSQPILVELLIADTVLNLVKEKFESKSQPDFLHLRFYQYCFKSCQRKI